MEDLKNSLRKELSHVREVWFDANENWYLHKVASAVMSMTREEILGEKQPDEAEEQTGKKRRK